MRSKILVLVVGLLTSACVSVPDFETDEVTPADIAVNIKCELMDAIWSAPDSHAWLRDWNATVTVLMNMVNKSDGSGEVGLAIPLTPGSAAPVLNFGASIEATRTVQLQFFQPLSRLNSFGPCPRSTDREILLKSELGFKEWFDRVRLADQRAEIFTDQIDYTLDFLIKKNLTPSVKFSLIPVGNQTFGASAKLDLQAQYKHNLKIVIKKPEPPKGKPKPIEVIIVSDVRAKEQQLQQLLKQRSQLEQKSPSAFTDGGGSGEDVKRQKLDALDGEIKQLRRDIAASPRAAVRRAPLPADGVPEEEKRRLNEALGRSLSTDIRDQLRDRGIDVGQ